MKEYIEIHNGEGRNTTDAIIDLKSVKVCPSCKELCHWARVKASKKFILVSLDELKRWRNHRVICKGGYNALSKLFEKIQADILEKGFAGELNDEVVTEQLKLLKNYVFDNFAPKK